MIKIKARYVEGIAMTLKSLMDDRETRIGGSTVLKLLKLERKLKEEYADIEAARWKMLNAYGNKGEDGKLKVDQEGNVEFPEEGRQKFMEEFSTLLATDIDIDLPQLTEAEFSAIQNVPLAAAALLEPIINIQ